MVLNKNMMMVMALFVLAYALKKTKKGASSTQNAPPLPTVAGYDMGGKDFGVTGSGWDD